MRFVDILTLLRVSATTAYTALAGAATSMLVLIFVGVGAAQIVATGVLLAIFLGLYMDNRSG